MRTRRCARGFTLIELLVVIAIIALLIGILLPALGLARRQGKLVKCTANERTYAIATGSYAAEKKDRLPAMDWRSSDPYPVDLPGWEKFKSLYFPSDLVAASFQVVSIIRHKTGLSDEFAPVPENWIPFILYTHVPLTDYIGGVMPSPVAACPEDAWRIAIQRQWDQPRLTGLPYPENGGDNTLSTWRWPFSTSYNIHQAHWGPSRAERRFNPTASVPGNFLTAIWYPTTNGGGSFYTKEGSADSAMPGQFGFNRLTDVRFPSQKVIMSDEFGRHFGKKTTFFAAPESVQPLAFYDGSVRVYQTGETNPGWDPSNTSTRGGSTRSMQLRLQYTKQQQAYDPDISTFTGVNAEGLKQYKVAAGWFRYTRGGLLGWDVPRGVGAGGRRATIIKPGPEQSLSAIAESELDTTTGTW
ncbi:MAG: prepilin-type N-terminal cleavage/methylation domain-containing protein [Phycisphaeraceae bacterium]|nr:prepilin-type N-terminal cleavage/methylation domain-containing protein [Phycisphaeraceae bacterium]